MSISIPRSLVEYILLGPAGDRRQLQDSPILVDVWIAFAKDPGKPQELLITPHRAQTAGLVATELDRLVKRASKDPADIAYLQGIIAARLYFAELLLVIVPMTEWWKSSRNNKEMQIYLSSEKGLQRINEVLNIVQRMVAHWSAPTKNQRVDEFLSSLDRYAALAGLILWASRDETRMNKGGSASEEEALAEAIKNGLQAITDGLQQIFNEILRQFPPKPEKEGEALVYQVSLNREATMAVARSVPAVKADAARTLFAVKCNNIAWAVIDSGIKGDHAAFKDADDKSRVKASFDFSNFRKIVSLDNLKILGKDAQDEEMKEERLKELLHDDLKEKLTVNDAVKRLTDLAMDAKYKRPIHWESVKPFVEINITTPPKFSDHGTHVAGIIGADRNGAKELPTDEQDDYVDGMCPDIQLYDFRVLAPTIKETEFAIIAALQYIRYMNERNDLHHDPWRQSQPFHPPRRAQLCLRPHSRLRRMRASGRQRRGRGRGCREPRLPELSDQGGPIRELYRIQRHRSGKRGWRDHRRCHSPLFAAHLRRELLLESRTDRGRPAEAGPRCAGRAHSRPIPRRAGAISTARAWRRRT